MAQQPGLGDIVIKSLAEMEAFLNRLSDEDKDNVPVPNPQQAAVEDSSPDEGSVWDAPDDVSEVPVYVSQMSAMQFRHNHLQHVVFCTTISYVAISTRSGEKISLCLHCYLRYAARTPLAVHQHIDTHYSKPYVGNGDRCNTCKARLYQQRPVDACIICNHANNVME